jgi:hypothetical protein
MRRPKYRPAMTCVAFFILSLLTTQFLFGQSDTEDIRRLPREQIKELKTEHCDYHFFIPKRKPRRILVIAHRTPNAGQSTTELSQIFYPTMSTLPPWRKTRSDQWHLFIHKLPRYTTLRR